MGKFKKPKPKPPLIVARRTEGFFGETNWSILKRSPFTPELTQGGISVLSDTEAQRLATLPLLEPGEDMKGIGARGYDPDIFFIEPD